MILTVPGSVQFCEVKTVWWQLTVLGETLFILINLLSGMKY